jgi:hypothetical protein
VLRMPLRPTSNVLPSGLSRGLPTSIDRVGPFFHQRHLWRGLRQPSCASCTGPGH